ncbi:MAG: TrkA family potassium uptake protein [Candidatus Krumholzibacteriota bacterium]|nr:TrkA family potassium uptake protein [Candidatus Krumholzibacteriota bacterium]
MYVIIAGAGRVGSEITRIMANNKHDVVVIDIDPHTCELLFSETGAMTINASATILRTLKKAGADKADALICLMHNEADNIACALLAKSLGVPRIVARMVDPTYEEAYRISGATTLVRSVDLLINQIVMEMENPEVKKVFTLGGGKAQIYSVKIPPGSRVINMAIKDITRLKDFPDECVFLGIYSEEKDDFYITRGEHVVNEGDNIFLVSKSEFLKKATKILI